MAKPSITIWIDPKTQWAKVEINPQELSPAQYGVVMSTAILQLAALFSQANPEFNQTQIIEQIRRGIEAGVSQMQDIEIPARQH